MRQSNGGRTGRRKHIIKISVSAMLIGISVILGYISRELLTFGSTRITFENLPVILSGILFGPFYGICVGVCTDLISSVSTGQDINPIITAGALSVGFVSGVMSKILSDNVRPEVRIVISCVSAHLFGCVLLKTLGLHIYYYPSIPFWSLAGPRLALYAFIAAAESILLCLILKNKYIKGFSDYEL